MDRPSTATLTSEQAKARLLMALDQCSPAHWVRAHPWGSLGMGFLSGYVLGTGRMAPVVLSEMVHYLTHFASQAKQEHSTTANDPKTR